MANFEIVQKIADLFLESLKEKRGGILVGYPRNLDQITGLEEIFTKRGRKLDVLIVLKVKEDIARERLINRGRLDDTPEIIARRHKLYFEQTEPIYDKAKEKGWQVLEIDGEAPIEEVTNCIITGVLNLLQPIALVL